MGLNIVFSGGIIFLEWYRVSQYKIPNTKNLLLRKSDLRFLGSRREKIIIKSCRRQIFRFKCSIILQIRLLCDYGRLQRFRWNLNFPKQTLEFIKDFWKIFTLTDYLGLFRIHLHRTVFDTFCEFSNLFWNNSTIHFLVTILRILRAPVSDPGDFNAFVDFYSTAFEILESLKTSTKPYIWHLDIKRTEVSTIEDCEGYFTRFSLVDMQLPLRSKVTWNFWHGK